MSSKLFSRLSEFVGNQTNEPSKKDLSDAIKQLYKEKAAKAKKEKKSGGEEKPKRKPSAYNEFYKEQSAILKEKEASLDKEDRMTAKEKMTYIANMWKEKKDEEAFEEAKEEEASESEPEPEPEPTPVKKGKGAKGK